MIDLIVNIKNFLINIFLGISSSIKLMINYIINVPAHVKNIKAKLADLESTNLEIADYHLKNGNLNDAILRLKILARFITPGSPKAHYKLAWCYFIKNDFNTALENLDKCLDLDIYGLKIYIQTLDPQEIPMQLLQEYKNLAQARYFEKFVNKLLDLHAILIELMLQKVPNMPKKCQILDLGSYVGRNGEEIAKKMPKEYTLTGIEDSQAMLEQTRLTGVYDNAYNVGFEDFLLDTETKYDIILSLNSLSFTKDTDIYFTNIHNALKSDGYFICAFKVGETSELDSNKVEFVYKKDDLEKSIISGKFMIIATKTVIFNSSTNYLFAVCRPNT
jgi:predicted TPR repeat methyltransferase